MQALAERLDAVVAGKQFAGFDALSFSSLKTVVPGPEAFVGQRVERVTRRGKYLIFEAGDAGRVLLHLSPVGRVDIEEPPERTETRGGGGRGRLDARARGGEGS